ncbi:Ras association domain-containing protein [Dirofilaria immitis]
MEIRVIADGIERCVSGITESTTCAQVIYALARATGQKGRFVLIEHFLDTERSLAPLDRPFEILRKWGVHSHCVSFLLKHLDEGPSPVTSENYLVDTGDRLEISQLEEPSFTSVDNPISQNGAHTYETDNEENRGAVSSAAVLTPMSEHFYRPASQRINSQTVITERIKNRPPPPAYHELIEQRFTSLSRQNTSSSLLTPLPPVDIFVNDQWRLINGATPQPVNLNSSDVSTNNLSANALEELVQNQKQFIDQQKAYLARLDLAIDNDQQREVVQLRRQQENLRAILNPLREYDWPNRLQQERSELEEITSSISEFEQKYDALVNEIKLRKDEEHKLKCRIQTVKEELEKLENDVEFALLSINNY